MTAIVELNGKQLVLQRVHDFDRTLVRPGRAARISVATAATLAAAEEVPPTTAPKVL